MKARRISMAVIAAALLAVSDPLLAQTPVSTAFSYQGQLKDGGIPADGDYDFVFRLFDDPNNGVQIGSDFPVDDWPVSDGLFTVQVDFGAGVFTGDALWLEVAVRPGASGDDHTVLSPRQPLAATPYALYALSGPGSGGFWAANGDNIYNNNAGGVGIGTTIPASMLDVQSTEGAHGIMSTNLSHIPVWAHRASTTGTFPAVHGECDSEGANGSAVRGIMTSTSPGSSSAAVRGINNGTGGAGMGVYGSQAGSGYGVYGYTPDGYGVYGLSTDGTGVWGATDSNSFHASGVEGVVNRTSPGMYSVGVLGHNNGTGNFGYGVHGTQDGSGIGVYGSTPSGYGVYGTTNDGTGVYGWSIGGTGVWGSGGAYGGYFEDSDNSGCAHVGYGNYGISAYGTSVGGYFADSDGSGRAYIGYGDYGIRAYGDVAGGYFEDSNDSAVVTLADGDWGVVAMANTAAGYFYDGDSAAWTQVGCSTYKVLGNGTVQFVQNHPEDPEKVIVYACPEGDEVATYTRGTARLINGEAVVPLGETFKWVTNPDIGLTAHLTPRGQAVPLAVVSLTAEELVVCGPERGPYDVAFDYIVYGLRIGFEEVSIVQEKDQEAYVPSMADHRELFERRPELRQYNALERFGAMRAALGETGPLDLTASHALRDAIVEFDPAVHELPGGGRPPPDDPVPAAERDDSGSAVDPDTGDEPIRPSAPEGTPTSAVGRFHETLGQKDNEIEALRARLDALEALVAELRNTEDGGAQ